MLNLELGKIFLIVPRARIIKENIDKFDFVNKKYVAVSGNDENIPREKLLDIIKPVAHYFTKGAATCC